MLGVVAAGGDLVDAEVIADDADDFREKLNSTVGMYLAVDEDVRGIGCDAWAAVATYMSARRLDRSVKRRL